MEMTTDAAATILSPNSAKRKRPTPIETIVPTNDAVTTNDASTTGTNEAETEERNTKLLRVHTHPNDISVGSPQPVYSVTRTSAAPSTSSAFSTPNHSNPASAFGSPFGVTPTSHVAASSQLASHPNTTNEKAEEVEDEMMPKSPASTYSSPISSNAPSPSATPKLHPAFGLPPIMQFPHLTVNTTTLGSADGSRTRTTISPSSSPTHSPTSTASQLRPVQVSHLELSPVARVASSTRAGVVTLSPRCPQHLHTAALSPSRLPSSGGSSVASTSSSPHASPSRIAQSPSHGTPWKKPTFLQKLQVTIPELSPIISSPVAHGMTPSIRPSQVQIQKDRERVGTTGGSALTPLSCAVVPVDGVVSSGPHYSISLLKGRRRNMEDMYIQATIPTSAHENTDHEANTAASAAADSEPAISIPLTQCNFFGIADGHGKNGALVAQITAQLLPDILAQELTQPTTAFVENTNQIESLPTNDQFRLSTPAIQPITESTTASVASTETAQPPQSVRSIFQSPLPHPPVTALSTLTSGASAAMPSFQLDSSSHSPLLTSSSSVCGTAAMSVVQSVAGEEQEDSHLDEAPVDGISAAIQAAYLKLDSQIMTGKYTGGSTCTTALIHSHPSAEVSTPNTQPSSSTLYVANVGDSRCVLSRAGQAIALTSDHKPDRPDERSRIEKAGGKVVFVSGWRVDGILNISRAIGDIHLKDAAHPQQSRIIARPEVTVHRITPEDEFIILASDGVWGRMENQAAVDLVRRVLLGGGDAHEHTHQPLCSSTTGIPPETDLIQEAEELPMGLPPRIPSLTQEHSYVQPIASNEQRPKPMNPIATPRGSAVPPIPELMGQPSTADDSLSRVNLDRMDSSETIHSTTRTPHSFTGGLNTDGTLNTMASSTHLTQPMAATHLQPEANDLPVAAAGATTTTATDTDATTAVDSILAPPLSTTTHQLQSTTSSTYPCCWSMLSVRPDLIESASEALIRHAYEELNSMDNISVAIVLLYPFQPTQTNLHEEEQV